METEVIVPDAITLKSDGAERIIRLENCHNQNEIMEYLKICLSLCYVHLPDRIMADIDKSTQVQPNVHKKYEIPDNANPSKLCITKI